LKKTTLFLAIIMLLILFTTACEKNNNDTSSIAVSESVTSGDISGTVSEPEEISPEFATVVSSGKEYTVNNQPGETYPDTYSSELTDGIHAVAGTGYSDAKLSGWAVDNLAVIIDLGDVYDKLYGFEVSYLSTNVAGIAPPANINIQYSEDGEKWGTAGYAKMPEYEEDTIKVATLTTKVYIKAQYVKFTIKRGSAWLFLDELSVIADVDGGNKNVQFLESMLAAYNADSTTNTEKIEALNSVSKALVDRTLNQMSVSKGKSYTLSRTADTIKFIDENNTLTDGGLIEALYESGAWVGFEGGEALDIIVDLGKTVDNAADFEISFFNNYAVGISLPDYVTISVSSDKTNYVEIGRVYGSSDRECTSYNYALHLQYAVSACYVKFSIPESEFDWYLIEEAAVYRYGTDAEAKDSLYPDIVLPTITKEEFWNSSKADYSKNINLIKDLSPQIISAVPMPSSESEYNSVITQKMLTDGILASNTGIHNGQFFKFHAGSHRDVIFDLTKTSTITGFTARFVRQTDWAVTLPPNIYYYLSDDGINWYQVGISVFPTSEAVEVVEVELNLNTVCKARFIRFSFDVGTWAGCDELQVFGTKKVASGTKALSSLSIEPVEFLSGEYITPDESILGGVKDLMLSYHCNYADEKSNPESGYMSIEQYMPYVAYIDGDGKILDVMFDGYLYLPTSAALPSGGYAHKDTIKSDWEYVLNNMFRENYNIDALDQAAQKVKDELKLNSDYKYKVYIALLYPTEDITFGDFNGDGTSEKFSDVETRVAALEWYVNTFLDRFESGSYENLEFAGFYWHHEAMNSSDNEMELINGVADMVHSYDYQLFWIPYYLSNGYNQYKEYGFDFACMQPNYAFNESVQLSNIEYCAVITKLYNMCFEMEIDPKALYNYTFYKRWMEYLKGGVYYGYIDAIHMYYQGGMPGAFYTAALSDDRLVRLVYDYTYDFIKGTLKLKPDSVAELSFTAKKDEVLTDTLSSGKNVEITKYRIFESPKNGTITINADGSFMYYPNKGFTGTDTFSYAYSEQLDYSDACSIKITIGE